MTTEQESLDRDRTAVLIMDFQNDIVNSVAQDPQMVVQKASLVLNGARQVGIPVIYVVHRGGRFEDPSAGAEIHPDVSPAPGERVIPKTKAGPFSTTGLDVILREMGRDTLVLMGVATSGCVLSASRWAADVNYKVVVVKDACDDRDPEVHRVLTEKVFARQRVLTAEEFLQAVGVS
jgi:nicotinamidase-related amidase